MIPSNDLNNEWQYHQSALIKCRKCERLVTWREQVAQIKRRAYRSWEYWGKPVPGFGDPQARILVIGLAPGAHGSNRTGRMFTGDASGDFLYPSLFKAGFANQPDSSSIDDHLSLKDLYITAVCRCAPPENKVTQQEIKNCRPYLLKEVEMLENLQGIVALGRLAFEQALLLFNEKTGKREALRFLHGGLIQLSKGKPWLLASYHPSRQNTQTGRLTVEMFDSVWEKARSLLC